MKTNVVMIRKMGELEVYQRTQDGMFDATYLLKQWSKQTGNRKDISAFLKLDSTKEFITALESTETRKVVSVTKGGKSQNQGTWMQPLLFIDFCMWINPTFKVTVLRFVYDELIKQRTDAGDGYIALSAAGIKLNGYDFIEVAKALQWLVFGRSGKELRQTATQDELKMLNTIQTQLAFAIDMGYIKTYEQLINEMRKLWNLKNKKF